MYMIQFSWKSFRVSLAMIEEWMKTNAGDKYTGNSADSCLSLWFSEEPSQDTKDAVEAYWTAIESNSLEATKYVAIQTITEAITTLKAGIPAKTWNQMNGTERKLVLGLDVTPEELGLI